MSDEIRLTVRLALVKREASNEASQPVRGLGGPAQDPPPPSHDDVVEWLSQGWPLCGAQPRGLGGPAQVPPVQEPVKQDPVKQDPVKQDPVKQEPVKQDPDQEAPAAAVQAPVQRDKDGLLPKQMEHYLCPRPVERVIALSANAKMERNRRYK